MKLNLQIDSKKSIRRKMNWLGESKENSEDWMPMTVDSLWILFLFIKHPEVFSSVSTKEEK